MALPDISERYILPAVRPDWEELLADWQPLLPPQRSPWLLTKFGELFFCHQDGKIGMLQVSGFQYQVVTSVRVLVVENQLVTKALLQILRWCFAKYLMQKVFLKGVHAQDLQNAVEAFLRLQLFFHNGD